MWSVTICQNIGYNVRFYNNLFGEASWHRLVGVSTLLKLSLHFTNIYNDKQVLTLCGGPQGMITSKGKYKKCFLYRLNVFPGFRDQNLKANFLKEDHFQYIL